MTVKPEPICVRIEPGDRVTPISRQWYKLLLRLQALPNGCHTITLVKDGDEPRWSIQSSGKVER